MKTESSTPGPGVDTSGTMRPEHARALVAAGKRFVARILCLPERSAANDLTAAELAMLTDAGLAVFVYAFLRRGGHTAETGAADGAAMVKAADAIGYPKGAAVFVDLECDMTPSRPQAEAYARAWRDTVLAAGRVPGAYLDRTFMRSGCDLAGMFEWWWQAGSAPPCPDARGYALKQSADLNVTFAGLPFDLDEMSGPLPWCVADAAPQPVPGPDPMPKPTGPDLSFRKVIPGEPRPMRVTRMGYHIAITNGPRNSPDGSRALLEPGAHTVAWTCMMTLRAIEYHSHLRPEDGWKVITIDGETFGDDYGPKLGDPFETRILKPWGTYYGGSLGKQSGVWPMDPGVIFCKGGTHVGLVCFVEETSPGVYKAYTIEGGQADGPVDVGTHSWTLGDDGQPHEFVINDHRLDDHCQPFVRTFSRAGDKIAGLYGVSSLRESVLHENAPEPAPIDPPKPPSIVPPAPPPVIIDPGPVTPPAPVNDPPPTVQPAASTPSKATAVVIAGIVAALGVAGAVLSQCGGAAP